MAKEDERARARWLLAAALAPFAAVGLWIAAAPWLEKHVSVHNDVPFILALFFFWAAGTLAVAVIVPWACWRWIGERAGGAVARRRWRAIVVLGSLLGCIAFLATVLWGVENSSSRPRL
jgi:hypothetical protein